MTTAKHTPWEVSPHPWPEQIGCCPLIGRPYSIHGTDYRNVAAATTIEIARLIAAAPELLEALKDVLATCAPLTPKGRSYVEASRSIIAKAEGRP